MASRVEFAVSMTPIKTIAAAGDSPEIDVIATDIGKTLGSSGSVLTGDSQGDHVTLGFANGTPSSYLNCNPAAAVGSNAQDFVFIKHTGKVYDIVNNTIGTTVSETAISLRTTASDGAVFCKLNKGESIILPRCDSEIYITGATDVAVLFACINES